MLAKIRIDVDDEERADVVGDVVAGERQRDHPRILSSEARPPPRRRARAPSRSSASRPASVLPPGEATALRTSAGWRRAQQLRRAGGGLDHQLARQLGVEPVGGAGVGDRLDRQRQVGRRAAHHRGRRVEVLVGELDHVPEQLQLRPHRRRGRRRRRRARPAGPRPPTFGITRSISAPGKRRRAAAPAASPASIETTLPRRGQLAAPPPRASPASPPARRRSAARGRSPRSTTASRPSSSASAGAGPEPQSENSMPLELPGPAARHRRSHAARIRRSQRSWPGRLAPGHDRGRRAAQPPERLEQVGVVVGPEHREGARAAGPDRHDRAGVLLARRHRHRGAARRRRSRRCRRSGSASARPWSAGWSSSRSGYPSRWRPRRRSGWCASDRRVTTISVSGWSSW